MHLFYSTVLKLFISKNEVDVVASFALKHNRLIQQIALE